MRVPDDLPPRRERGPRRGRIAIVVALVAFLFLLTSLRGIAGFWTDYLWFESLGLSEVFAGVLGAQLTLVALFSLGFALLLFVNLTLADRFAPRFRPASPEELMLARYQEIMGRRAGLVRAGISLFLGLLFGASAGTEWNTWLLFANRQSFGVADPEFGRDIGFYVFELPFYTFLVDWLFVSLVVVAFITALAHYLNGGIRLQAPLQKVTPQVKTHLSVVLALAAGAKAVDYWLQRFDLTTSSRGVVDGAGYTDLQAQLPALELLVLISLAACVLFIVNIWRRGWVLPSVAVGLWLFSATVAGTIYPAVVQRFVVAPEESARELPYIERNIAATRAALGVDSDTVEVVPFNYDTDLSAADLSLNEETIRNLRILDPAIVGPTFNRLQAGRSFYRFTNLDVDRYTIEGPDGEQERIEVLLATRELNLDGIQQPSWEAQHAAYTHGYGVALAPSNAVTESGFPDFLMRDMPVTTDPALGVTLEEPSIYVGEGLGGYSLVGTARSEVDYVTDAGVEVTGRPYTGTGGVRMSGGGVDGFLRRAAFALRFGEVDPMISRFITPESRVIYVRDVRERVEKAAPFMHFDADPYPVVHDGRIVYIIDGYTTTNRYPYAQRADTGQLSGRNSGLRHNFNYVRNSVKGVVDAYDGDVTLYVIDEEDPITRAYRQAFPNLFADFEDLPDGLENHLRYPDDLFIVQTTMWGRYHIEDPSIFYNETEAWEVAQSPVAGVVQPAATGQATATAPPVTDAQGNEIIQREDRIPPYFLLMRLPEQDDASFLSMRPFVRASRRDEQRLLTSFMVAKADPGEYGQLIVYELDQALDGPSIVAARMLQDQEVATTITLLSRQSAVEFGNMLLIPIEDSILYVRPMYVRSAGDSPVPELANVVLALDDQVVMEETLPKALLSLFEDDDDAQEALEAIFDRSIVLDVDPDDPDADPDDPDADPDDPEARASVEELLTDAADLFAEAEQILADLEDLSDLAAYQERMDEAREKVAEALVLLGVDPDDLDGELDDELGDLDPDLLDPEAAAPS
jgi:uncharacterized protein